MGLFDSFYLARVPSFPARHASFEEIEEILLVKGMTPELFYGGYGRDADGRLVPQPGLRDCVSVYGMPSSFDVNSVEPALMVALGVSPELARLIVETRRMTPFRKMDQVLALAGGPAPGLNRLSFSTGTIFTLRATARPRTANGPLSDLRRTVAALVKIFEPGSSPPSTILRWYDTAAAPARMF
jgi:general secretion pathway protein K